MKISSQAENVNDEHYTEERSMDIALSQFLEDKKNELKKVIADLAKDFQYVSILGVDSDSKTYSVSRSGISVYEDKLCNDRGFVVRVFNGYGYSEYSFNGFDTAKVVAEVKNIAQKDIAFYKEHNIQLRSYPVIQEEKITKTFHGTVEQAFDSQSDKEKIARIVALRERGLSYSKKFLDFPIIFQQVTVRKIFLSLDKDLSQAYAYSIGYFLPIAQEGEKIVNPYSSFSGAKGLELLDEMDSALDTEAKKALDYLIAERVVPGKYEVICSPGVTGLIAHEAFGHGVEMDMFVKDRAKAKDYIHKQVASPITQMHDGAAAKRQVSSYFFDDEGVLAGDTLIIKDGILQQGICDMLSALALGVQPTGNGKRQGYERKAYTRMTNTFFSSGNATFDDMLKSIKHGYLLEDYMSGMEDPKNWGIQCCLGKGYEIKDGKLSGKVISPVYLTGYVPDLLKSFVSISGDTDFDLAGSGYCGKGYKEYVRTSCGGTFIKATANLS